MGTDGNHSKNHEKTDKSPRDWCAEAVARLHAGRPEEALNAAREAAAGAARDERGEAAATGEWAHRLMSLAVERLGRDADALPPAREAVRLAPGSWPARVRLATALARLPGHADEAAGQAGLARAFAPEEPAPHALEGDLALLRGDHAHATTAYRTALATATAISTDPGPGPGPSSGERPGDAVRARVRVNLGLALLRWDRPRAHHDPAWPVDPRETGRARRALEVWSRQARLLAALATIGVAAAAQAADLALQAKLGGLVALALLAVLTVRQARRIRVWPLVPAMMGRDPWLGTEVVSAAVSVAAYAAWLGLTAAPGVPPWLDPVWAGLAAVAVLGWPAHAALRALAGTWRGHPVRALEQFAAVDGERTARRNAGVTLWILLGRTWSVLAPLACAAVAVEPRAALAAVAVPYPLLRCYRRARHGGEDGWLRAAVVLLVLAAAGCAAGALLEWSAQDRTAGAAWAWRVGMAALGLVAVAFAVRAGRAWWRGGPGPWRSSLLMCDLPAGDEPSVPLGLEARQALAYARNVVLSFADPLGPRTVGAAASIGPAGELRLVAEAGAGEAVEADPRVAVFAAGPSPRRRWVEVRGVAVAAPGLLRVTPKQVLTGEFPGRHQRG
ncbi:hypothetical protein MTP10_22615 [Nonomuraea sp. 3-1Str]|uniref:hypothetical protein n=1 Tax=Nonomuraea sp. 3-1Str TaxID=2929801 RepID=UPI00286369EE|nr:hypothetical protein [Nonomuraea sp. 3-1Str]MDR8411517.1 hypothetical protein [Nonomuraea sp. 3-1Str]